MIHYVALYYMVTLHYGTFDCIVFLMEIHVSSESLGKASNISEGTNTELTKLTSRPAGHCSSGAVEAMTSLACC